jgi:hypothetical protein
VAWRFSKRPRVVMKEPGSVPHSFDRLRVQEHRASRLFGFRIIQSDRLLDKKEMRFNLRLDRQRSWAKSG